MKKVVASFFVLFFIVVNAQAATITASEFIIDRFDGDQRDFERTRENSDGFFNFENNDGLIILENALSPSFGVLGLSDVSYRHDLTWLDPGAENFVSATLTIGALFAVGGNDQVYVETFNFGSLNQGILTSTEFISNNSALLSILFADGFLDIFINKNEAAGRLGSLNALTVFSSKLEIEYTPVPEPGTMALLGAGVLGAAAKRRRAKAAA